MSLHTISEAIREIKEGRLIVVVDDEDRENEGDLVMAASMTRPADINFMAKFGRGLICVPMTGLRLDALGLRPMSPEVGDTFRTGWAISCDAREGVTTGISAHDRARTARVLADPRSKGDDLVVPGHLFPLRAHEGGVLARAGHTEASIDLMKLAGLEPTAVICEIMKEDGTMARLNDLKRFAAKHKLKIISIADLIEYRRRSERLIRRLAETVVPTDVGTFNAIVYESTIDAYHHLALTMGRLKKDGEIVRVHSECLTGDVFGSRRCDCGEQLKKAMRMISDKGHGVILYMRQEGRGIGLANKLRAYELQDRGLDTVEANKALGFKPDLRDYGIGAQILTDLGLRKIRLVTNNPKKIVGLEGYGLEVVERIPLLVKPNVNNLRYLKAKKEKLGHEILI